MRMRHENKKRQRNYASAEIPSLPLPLRPWPVRRRRIEEEGGGRVGPLAPVALTEVEISIEGGGGVIPPSSSPRGGGVFEYRWARLIIRPPLRPGKMNVAPVCLNGFFVWKY